MDPYKLVARQALAKLNKAIREARAEYKATMREIRKLQVRITSEGRKRKPGSRALAVRGELPFHKLTIAEAITVLLQDSQLSITELTVEIQARGIRSDDDPRRVAHAVRAALLYHRDRFKRDRKGRWGVV